MTVHRARGPALAALLLLVPCLAHATPAARLQPSLQRALVASGRPAGDAVLRLDAALHGTTPLQAAALALPESRAALASALAAAGVGEALRQELVPGLVEAAREASMDGTAWTEPMVSVGTYQLSLSDLGFVVGPRYGRDRHEVLRRLDLVSAGDGAAHADAGSEALVAELVSASDSARSGTLLARLIRALLSGEDQ